LKSGKPNQAYTLKANKEIKKMNEFKQWLLDNYSHNELADIARHGCSGGVGGMVYYSETKELYTKFAEAIHKAVYEYIENIGEHPSNVIEEIGDFRSFANWMVWFAAEWFAHEITGGEYIEKANRETTK
jgi:hypothetical protein